jgi:hypothetical protein
VFSCPVSGVKVYPSSILKPLILQNEAFLLTTEDTSSIVSPLPANWKPSSSQLRALNSIVKMIIWDIFSGVFKVYPSSILEPLFLETEALNLTTEDTSSFSALLPANWKHSGSLLRALEKHVKYDLGQIFWCFKVLFWCKILP